MQWSNGHKPRQRFAAREGPRQRMPWPSPPAALCGRGASFRAVGGRVVHARTSVCVCVCVCVCVLCMCVCACSSLSARCGMLTIHPEDEASGGASWVESVRSSKESAAEERYVEQLVHRRRLRHLSKSKKPNTTTKHLSHICRRSAAERNDRNGERGCTIYTPHHVAPEVDDV